MPQEPRENSSLCQKEFKTIHFALLKALKRENHRNNPTDAETLCCSIHLFLLYYRIKDVTPPHIKKISMDNHKSTAAFFFHS